jgi:branched-chain amino acid transport system ATP-binding protein
MKGDNMLEAKKICKHFEGLKAVNDVSFTIEKGEILGLIGPNGAGKTTIFNMIAAVFPLTSGEIYFNGKLISNLKKPSDVCKAGIGRTFQVVKPFGGMTVLENVMVGAFNVTNSVSEATEKAMKAMDQVGLLRRKDMLFPLLYTTSIRLFTPEWKKVESPITATTFLSVPPFFKAIAAP